MLRVNTVSKAQLRPPATGLVSWVVAGSCQVSSLPSLIARSLLNKDKGEKRQCGEGLLASMCYLD